MPTDATDADRFFAEGGKVYERRLGEAHPMTDFNVEQRVKQHRVDAEFYQRADPDRAAQEIATANFLEALAQTANEQLLAQ